MQVLEAMDSIRQTLQSAGIRAETDPRNVNAPGAWIALQSITHNAQLCGSGTVRLSVYLIVPDAGIDQSTANLALLLSSLLSVIDPDDDTTPTSVTLPGGGNGLPALRVTVDVATT